MDVNHPSERSDGRGEAINSRKGVGRQKGGKDARSHRQIKLAMSVYEFTETYIQGLAKGGPQVA